MSVAIADSVPRINAAGVSIDRKMRGRKSNGMRVWSPSGSATGDDRELGTWCRDDER